MKALSIRQPWAWLILNAGKDIENRDWRTHVRGRVLIHAAKGMTLDEWGGAWGFAEGSGASTKAIAAGVTSKNIERGGIIGSVEIVDCVTESNSRWFMGRYGFVLRDPKPLPFIPWKGQLGFFDVPDSVISPKGEGRLSMVRTRYHLRLNIQGFMRQNTFPEGYDIFQRDDGTPMSPGAAFTYLNAEEAKGRKVIPCSAECGNPCEQKGCKGFDYSGGGCPGYPIEEEGD